MVSKVFCLLVIIIGLASCTEDQPNSYKNDLLKNELFGNIKHIISKESWSKSIKKGFWDESIKDQDYRIMLTSENMYDSLGNMVRCKSEGYSHGDFRQEIKYDSLSRVSELRGYEQNNRPSPPHIIEYNERGLILKVIDGTAYKMYIYDSSWNLIEINLEVDDPSKLTDRQREKLHPINKQIVKYNYDDKNRVIKITKEKWNHKSKKKHGMIEELVYENDLVSKSHSTNIRTGSIKIRKYKYHNFDSKGNWLKRVTSNDNGKIEIIEREITYYN